VDMRLDDAQLSVVVVSSGGWRSRRIGQPAARASDTRCDSNLSRIRLDPARNLPGPRTELLLEVEAPLLEVEEGLVALLLSALRRRTRQHRCAGGTCCCSPIPSGAQELHPAMVA
jgi:hypothetical protein